MRAVVCQATELSVQDLPSPDPGPGQVRVQVLRAGICGSDLHAREGADSFAEIAALVGYDRFAHVHDPVVFGHEYCATVAEYGPGTPARIGPGTPVVAVPLLRQGRHVDSIGLSRYAPGAYAEELLVQSSLMLAVPNGLAPELAALTEPLAVAHHAVRRAEMRPGQPATVIGAGPIGLGVILALKAAGVDVVVASDPSPGRRELARDCGADLVVDPAVTSPFDPASPAMARTLRDAPTAWALLISAMERLEASGLADARPAAATPGAPVIFECVGVPGMLQQVLAGAPLFSRVVVAGVCVGRDTITPALAIQKEVDLRFVYGYSPAEFGETLHLIAEGTLDPRPMITATVGLDGVAHAFGALAGAGRHAKVLIDPQSRVASLADPAQV